MSNLDTFKSLLQKKLNNASFHDHEDHVRRRSHLGVKTCTGHERWVDGQTGSADISVRQEGDSLVADVSVPYTAKYHAKNFTGVLCEYKDDPHDCSGTAQFKLTRMPFFGSAVDDFRLINPSPGEGHDAGRMCKEAIMEDIIGSLDNLLK